MKRYIQSIVLLFLSIHVFSQLRVGDPGVTIDQSKFDADYPQMERWANTGVRGGIPFLDQLEKGATVTAKTNAGINTAINNCPAGKYVYLPNGKYSITGSVNMKKDVFLVGESRDGVICEISMTSGNAFSFDSNDSDCGIYNITIQGSWGTPQYDWNFGLGTEKQEELKGNSNVSVKFKASTDCFLDNVKILNSAMHPVWINAKHITLRDLHIDGVFNKGGGAQGYLMVLDSDNLVTGCYVTHLRHFSLQGENSEYNVVYDNTIEQEISFHTGDGGNNLIENNTITLPADMWDGYYAIMGPWSSQHILSLKPNYLYRNTCYQHNQKEDPLSPWSDGQAVYYGPHKVKPLTHDTKINNFTAYDKGLPQGSVLYAINGVGEVGEQKPYSGTPISIPGVIEAEGYDTGGEGVSFHDTDGVNKLNEYRTGGVDIEVCGDGGYNIGWIANGEWLVYTVNVEKTGKYSFTIRAASLSAGGTFHLEIDDKPITDAVSVPVTEDWQVFSDVIIENVELTEGKHVLKFVSESAGYNFDKIVVSQGTKEIVKLSAGWNLVGYPYEGSKPIETALSSIMDQLIIVKGFDSFYEKENATFSSLKELKWGRGYFVKVATDCELKW